MATDKLLGSARAALGQGLMMGFGDEAEAWLRSKTNDGSYEANLQKIRKEYGQYAKENPIASIVSEVGGGIVPGVAAMFIPGMQPAAAASTIGGLARLSALGATSGAVSGAGSATEGQRGSGAVSGAFLGGALGATVPVALRGVGGGAKWLNERLFPTEALAQTRATEKFAQAMRDGQVTPRQIEAQLAKDAQAGIPSVVANANPALADLAEAVAQRTGRGARRIEETINKQKLGSRERTYQQTVKGLDPGEYYADEAKLVNNLRSNAKGMYDAAYAHGEVNDPRIMEVLSNPQFKGFYDKARSIADNEALAAKLRGEDPSKYMLNPLYIADEAGNVTVGRIPDVRTLDYIKRGIDATVDSGFKGQGMSTAEANGLRALRKEFVNAIDENVPAYKAARGQFSGDMEVIDAMRAGMSDFGKLDSEQIIKMVTNMGQAEKEAFRTGVARDLYGRIMNPSGNFNSAQKIIGSPEMQAKLKPLFDSSSHFDLFKNALERESQLFHQSNKILGGSPTGKRTQMRDMLEEGSGIGEAVASAVTGGFWPSLTGMAARAIRSTSMTEPMAEKLSKMLMSKDPQEVATVIKLLEEQALSSAPRALRATLSEAGAVTGTTGSIFPASFDESTPSDIDIDVKAGIEADLKSIGGSDIEADIEADLKKSK